MYIFVDKKKFYLLMKIQLGWNYFLKYFLAIENTHSGHRG